MKFRQCAPAVLTALALAACSQPMDSSPREITTVRSAPAELTSVPELTTAQRLRVSTGSPHGMMGGGEVGGGMASGTTSDLAWTLPEGWFEKPATPLRVVNLQAGPDQQAECYVTILGGDGGGVEANVNRWRKQMGLPDYTPDEFAALETRELFGQQATLVDMRGSFSGMGGTTVIEDARLLGLVLIDHGRATFVKLTGPADIVAEQADEFESFIASLEHGGHNHAAAAETSASEAPAPEAVSRPPFDAASLKWEAPEGWEQGPERMMRVVTFNIGETECYVSVLGGDGGGMAANINRWQGQMGQPALTEEAIAALPTVEILGVPSPVASIEGDYTGMSGDSQSGYTMIGTVCLLGNQTLFVKMIGPSAEAAAQRDKFVAFCESFSLK